MSTQKDNIVTGTKLLGFYVQDMLDLAQIRSGKIVKNIERVDINAVMREILSTQDIMASHKKVQLILHEFEEQDMMMDIDPQRLQQVSLNLLTNAMKFSKAGGKVQIGGKILTEVKGEKLFKYVQIFVQDSGYGISQEDKGKLFKLFGKLSQKNGLNKHGIGLGLHICKQICELFGGDIDVESELEVGSKFFFKFMISESQILNRSLEPDDIQISVDVVDVDLDVSVGPSGQVTQMQNLENQNFTVMKDNTEAKLVVFEDDSCMEVPDSDGENMPDNKYEFNTNKHKDATKSDKDA